MTAGYTPSLRIILLGLLKISDAPSSEVANLVRECYFGSLSL